MVTLSNNFVKILLVVILGLLIYLAFKPDGNTKYLKSLEANNKLLSEQIDSVKKEISKQIETIKLIEKKETIIRNYYNEIYQSIDTVNNDADAVKLIRQKLDKLGTARFE
jgi:hypothetical protein